MRELGYRSALESPPLSHRPFAKKPTEWTLLVGRPRFPTAADAADAADAMVIVQAGRLVRRRAEVGQRQANGRRTVHLEWMQPVVVSN